MIGKQFLLTAVFMGVVAMLLSILFRIQLAWPGESSDLMLKKQALQAAIKAKDADTIGRIKTQIKDINDKWNTDMRKKMEEVKKELAGDGDGKVRIGDISKRIADKWKALSDEERKKYDEMSGESRTYNYDDRHTILEMQVDLDLEGYEDMAGGKQTGIALPYVVSIDYLV